MLLIKLLTRALVVSQEVSFTEDQIVQGVAGRMRQAPPTVRVVSPTHQILSHQQTIQR